MTRIGLVLASMPDDNPGMASVNLAARNTMRELGFEFDVFEAVKRHAVGKDPVSMELLGNLERLASCDRIVYWGDWLHMSTYVRSLAGLGARRSGALFANKFEEISRHLYLTSLPDKRLESVAVVGTTLALESPSERALSGLAGQTERLYSRAGLVKMRDIYSANIASAWRSDFDNCLGLDGALADPFRPAQSAMLMSPSMSAGYFFGRSRNRDLPKTIHFLNRLRRLLGVDFTWVPWLPGKSTVETRLWGMGHLSEQAANWVRRSRPTADDGLELHESRESLDDLLDSVRRSQFILTDTYHLAVLSWANGVPALLLGETSSARNRPVNAGKPFSGIDKRMLLYLTLDAMDYFIPFGDVRDLSLSKSRAQYVANSVLANRAGTLRVVADIESRRQNLMRSLAAWLR